jgi:ferritin
MINENVEKAINTQINAELYSEYLYLSMSAYFKSINLNGCASWMNIQAQEERAHAMGMFDYVIRRGGKIVLEAIEKPQTSWKDALDVFKSALKHEELVTSKINALANVAQENSDRATSLFLNWYITEQVEEEENFADIIAQVEMVHDNPAAMFALDKELGARQFVAPVIK